MMESTRKQVTKKEACEETMARLEKEIERLSKGHVYLNHDVYTRTPTRRAHAHIAILERARRWMCLSVVSSWIFEPRVLPGCTC
jgi:hypothetical protein